MEGSKKKKAIDQSLMELKKKYKIPDRKEHSDEDDNKASKKKSESYGGIGTQQISKVIRDNVNNLMQQVTNLYVGNLSPEVTE